ncbi:MAG: anaerobic sulfatase maturase, partial [Lentisphaeria bacterium]|nr:anaerobic sulfatase maturase [Lentisphaeria bacterium]
MNHPISHLEKLPEGRNYTFHTMIKPHGAACNLNCKYCFYLHKSDLLEQENNPVMSDEVLEQHIRQYIGAQTGDRVVFSWQGGESTLLGINFFRKVVKLQSKYKKESQVIENDLQTNGTLLNEEWMVFLKENGFHVGLSIDGPRQFHDQHRLDKGGNSTFDKVMRAASLLRKYDIPFAALCVVNRLNSKHPLEVYHFLSTVIGSYRIQFTPAVEPIYYKKRSPKTNKNGGLDPIDLVTDWSVTSEDYGKFLIDIWDEWLVKDFGRIHVNVFETAVAQSLGKPAQMCTTAAFCGKGLAIEANGDVYSCDHLVYPDYKLGNILEVHEGDLAFSQQQVSFGMAKSDKL